MSGGLRVSQSASGLGSQPLSTMPATPIITTASVWMPKGLCIGYQKTRIAETSEEMTLGSGTHYLLARNGRGKTTLLKTLSGLLKPVSGSYQTKGHCQFVGDDLSFDRELSATLIFRAFLLPGKLDEAFALADELELDVRKPFGQLSFGNRKKVGLVVAELTLDPGKAEILFYDEPFTGLDTPARLAVLARWRRTENEAIRIVSCHPDFDAMEMPKALLIADGKIFVAGDGTQTWADLKNLLT